MVIVESCLVQGHFTRNNNRTNSAIHPISQYYWQLKARFSRKR